MAYVPLPRFLFRAPLLDVRAVAADAESLWAHPLGRSAIALASPSLAAALNREGTASPKPRGAASAESRRALARYTRRAAFRPTPSGLLAGVGLGRLGQELRMSSGVPRATGRIAWARLAALARSLLSDVEARLQTRLRLGPSVLVAADFVVWLGPGDGGGGYVKETRSTIDAVVGAVLETARAWTPWSEVRGAVIAALGDAEPSHDGGSGRDGAGDETDANADSDSDAEGDADADGDALADSIDDVLLTMIDDGFLHSDLIPPLVGPPPDRWMEDRLGELSLGSRASGSHDAPAEDMPELTRRLARASQHAARGEYAACEAVLSTLPGHVAQQPGAPAAGARAIEPLLLFGDDARAIWPEAVVKRAAALAPLLFRLQEALTPPLAERGPGPELADALDTVTELFGAGAFPMQSLATGEYGVRTGPEPWVGELGDDDLMSGDPEREDARGAGGGDVGQTPSTEHTGPFPPAALLTTLIDAITVAARQRSREIRLASAQLAEVLPVGAWPAPPPSCEIFLTPRASGGPQAPVPGIDGIEATPPGDREREVIDGNRQDASSSGRDAQAGRGWADSDAGWLLGVHAPAGSSWGRFGHAFSVDEQRELFGPLVSAERKALGGAASSDVSFSPDPALADLCVHPLVRDHVLAITHWPDPREALSREGERPRKRRAPPRAPAVATPAELELVAEPAAEMSLALRTLDGDPLHPSPLHRVRSATAPPGIWRLLTGWSLCRQHRPWAMTWGALANLEFLPRVWLDDFVIAPASWKIPKPLARRLAAAPVPDAFDTPDQLFAALADWRERCEVPRHVQIGDEDELLPVDLAARDAVSQLRGAEGRMFEIWPPLGDTPDQGGRRVEAVIALVDDPGPARRGRLESTVQRIIETGSVPAPHLRPSPARAEAPWLTIKLFGLAEAQGALLADIVHPVMSDARAASEVATWFFQRYVDPPGRRAHLRVRVQGDGARVADRIDARVEEISTKMGGQLVSLEQTPYFPELARFGGADSLPAIHRLFEADSELVCEVESHRLQAPDGAAADPENVDETLLLFIRALDDLAAALGWSEVIARRTVADARRKAHAEDVDADTAKDWTRAFRRSRTRLRALLAEDDLPSGLEKAFGTYRRAITRNAARLPPAQRVRVASAMFHVNAVRWLGARPLAEILAYTFWERTLDSVVHHAPDPRRRSR